MLGFDALFAAYVALVLGAAVAMTVIGDRRLKAQAVEVARFPPH